MGIVKRQSIISSVATYVGQGLGMINKMLIFPFVFLGQEEYWGLMELYLSIATILASFAHFGMPRVIQFFLAGIKDQDERKKLVDFAFGVTLVSLSLMLVALLFGQNILANFTQSPELFKEHYILLVGLLIAVATFELASSLWNAHYKSHVPFIYQNVVLRFGITILLVSKLILDFDIVLFIKLQTFAHLISAIALLVTFKSLSWRETRPSLKNEKRKGYFEYGFYGLLSTSSAWVLNYLDLLIIGMLLPLQQVALMALAKQIASAIHAPGRAILQASTPIIVKAYAEKDMAKVEELYKKTAFMETLVGGTLLVLICANLYWLLSLLPDESYMNLLYVVLFLGIGRMFDLATGANAVIIYTSSFYKINLYINLLLIVLTSVLTYFLVQSMGLLGAAIGTGVSILLVNSMMIVILNVKEKILPFQKSQLKLSINLLVSIFIISVLWYININLNYSVIISNLIFFMFIILIWFGIEDEELEKVKSHLLFKLSLKK